MPADPPARVERRQRVKAIALLLVCACSCATAPPAVVPPPRAAIPPPHAAIPPAPVESDVRGPDGVTLHVTSVGAASAPVVLVLHGGPGLSHDYLAPLGRLAEHGVRVVFYDQRGVGKSSRPPKIDDKLDPAAYTLAAYLADVAAVRATLGARVHFLGHSWGGLLAQAYAIDHPSEVASLVLVDSMPPTSAEADRGAARFAERRTALVAEGLVPEKPPPSRGDDCTEAVRASLPVYFFDPRSPLARDVGAMTCARGVGPTTLKQLGDYDRRAALSAVRLPALVVAGERDPFGVAWADETVAAIPGARRAIIARAGHMPWAEAPDAFFAEVVSFLSR